MNDTVTKLITLADRYALQLKFDLVNELNGKPTESAPFHRKALQDELVRLFTPLTDEEITKQYRDMVDRRRNTVLDKLQENIKTPCPMCGGSLQIDSNAYHMFLRCTACSHVPMFNTRRVDCTLEYIKNKTHGITGEKNEP